MIKDEVKEKIKFGEVINIIDGLTYSPDNITDDVTALKVLRSSNVQNGVLDLDDLVYVNGTSIKYDKYTQVNDILICVRNGSKSLIGKNCLIQTDIYPATHGAFMSVIRTSNPKYIYSLLNSQQAKREIYRNLSATINQITKNDLNNYKFKLHSEKLQTEIGLYLSQIDNLIQLCFQKKIKISIHMQQFEKQIFNSNTNSIQCNFDDIFEKVKIKTKLKKSEYSLNGVIPVISQEKKLINGFSDIPIADCNRNLILLGDHTLIIKYLPFSFVCGGDGTILLNSKLDLIYSFYMLKNNLPEPEGYKRHFSIIKELKFNIPKDEYILLQHSKFLSQMDNYIKTISMLLLANHHMLNFLLLTLDFLKFIIKIAST